MLSLDNDVILTYSRLYNVLKKKGMIIGDGDLLIASSAIAKNLTRYTRDFNHFERLEEFGLKLLKNRYPP